MGFLYPHIADLIDWQQPVEFLDNELQKITRKAKSSRRYADKLVNSGKKRVDNLTGYYRLAAQKKLSREHITQLVVFLAWIVALPEDLTSH